MHKVYSWLLLVLVAAVSVQAQVTVTGTVSDSDGPLIGATVLIEGTTMGSITDLDGKYSLNVPDVPATLRFSYTGYETQTKEVTGTSIINVEMAVSSELLTGVVISASGKAERELEAPITVESVSVTDIRGSASFSPYDIISNLKGVSTSTGGLTFTQINTRGFADMQNWRFVTLVDGMDVAPPGLNYAVGGNSGPADIDIVGIELVPGANSALYGANAFNGLLAVRTKDAFTYQGLSAYVKGGVTIQDAQGTNPLFDGGFRYARSVGDRFAFKVNFGTLQGTDWEANDESYYISQTIAASGQQAVDALLALPRDDPNFDAVNIYGDEVIAQVDLTGNGSLTDINRTGWKERDIIDYGIQLYKADASLYYKLGDVKKNNILSYTYRYLQSDAILRHTTVYPLRNLFQQWHRVNFEGSGLNFTAYYTAEDAADSYAMLATGAFLEQGALSNDIWADRYGQAFQGNIAGVAAGDHSAARAYADEARLTPDDPAWQALRDATLSNSNIAEGGSKFVDNTSMISGNLSYDLNETLISESILSVQVGANARRYNLLSEGQLFNDGPTGFNEPIGILEYGAFVQVGKKLWEDRISLQASARYDKNSNFDGRITPRASATIALDNDRNHYLRGSYQTGFRNPATQETYIALDIGRALLWGGVQDNWENSTFTTALGAEIDGITVYESLVDPLNNFNASNLDFIKQERNETFDVGYKGVWGGKLFLDVNYYRTTYKDFVYRATTFSTALARFILVYSNVDQDVTSSGVSAGADYQISRRSGLKIGANYTYAKFDAEEAIENTTGFFAGFNTPEHRFNLSLSGNKVYESDFGFDLKFRWQDDFIWESPFGVSPIESYYVVDLALTYAFEDIGSQLKIGANNLTMNEYQNLYGGPNVGSIFFIGWTYDELLVK